MSMFATISRASGNAYGYPQCCIDKFCQQTPEVLQRQGAPTREDKLRFKAAQINGKFTGFVPCYAHAVQIIQGKIKLEDLIEKTKRTVPLPFPFDWSLK
jgi:hypothetical protein